MAASLLRHTHAFLQEVSEPVADALHLPHLREHFPTLVYSALFFTFVHIVVAPLLSVWLAPETYSRLKGRKGRNNWNIHIVSSVHAALIVYLAVRALDHPSLNADRVFGWHETVGTVNAVACGYFLWDTIDAIVNFTDLGFVVHGAACTVLYGFTFRPFLGYYSSRYLLWELSTPFLNIHWFLDKLGRTGGILQYVNGVFLLLAFFFVRIVYGWYMNFGFWSALYSAKDQIPPVYMYLYLVGNLVLNMLNIVWFGKMIRAFRKRFEKDDVQMSNGKAH